MPPHPPPSIASPLRGSQGPGTEPANLHGVLSQRAAVFGDRQVYTFQGSHGDATLTFRELDRGARAIAARLQQTVQPGDRVMLLFPAGLDFIRSFFGCLYAGVLAVPTMYPKPRRPMPRLNTIARDCEASAILTDRETLATTDAATSELQALSWIAVDEVTERQADQFRPTPVDASNIAFLQYTSGSTSEPKGVMVSHANLLSNLEMIRQGFGLEHFTVGSAIQSGVFWLPAYHDMGLIGGILESLYVGGHSVLMSPAAFLQRPIGWLEEMSKYSALISGAPNFAYELCAARSTEEQRKGLDLSHWKVAFCGAEPIRPETLERFAEAFAVSGFQESAFYPCYGLAEATLLAAGSKGPQSISVRHVSRKALERHQVVDGSSDPDDAQRLVACGQALCGQEVAIVNPETQKRLDSGVGEIWIHGPSVAQGYWNRAAESESTFRARLADDPERTYLRTGDLGFLAQGQLFVTGRLKDMMIIRGRNHYPQDIEKTVGDAHEALRQDAGAVFSVSHEGQEQLVIVHEVDRQYREKDFDNIIRAIRRHVTEHHELDVFAVALIRHASLPRTTSGKVQRNFCRELFLKGEMKVLSQWNRAQAAKEAMPGLTRAHAEGEAGQSDPSRMGRPDHRLSPDEIARLSERVESWLLRWLVEHAAIPPDEVHRDKPFGEYGLDSMTAVELSQELEDWVGVDVVPTVAWNYPTPATLSQYLARAVAGDADAAQDVEAVPLDDEFARLLAEIEGLSDEEAQKRLAGNPGQP